MAHRIAPLAEADLDEIWLYVAKESGNKELAAQLAQRFEPLFGKFVGCFCGKKSNLMILPFYTEIIIFRAESNKN